MKSEIYKKRLNFEGFFKKFQLLIRNEELNKYWHSCREHNPYQLRDETCLCCLHLNINNTTYQRLNYEKALSSSQKNQSLTSNWKKFLLVLDVHVNTQPACHGSPMLWLQQLPTNHFIKIITTINQAHKLIQIILCIQFNPNGHLY